MTAQEANFDGLVGPTHNYAGLSFGNEASQQHRAHIANPRQAALQGLAKMQALHRLGLVQGVLAPQERPDLHTLRQLGFTGQNEQVLASAARHAPQLLAACCSASSMWSANAATVSPSADTADGRVHFTPANLTSLLHRAIEHPTSAAILRATFADQRHFCHHPALPGTATLADEGAANHTRLCQSYGQPGVALFVYGRQALASDRPAPQRYPARQTLEASQAVARSHGLNPAKVVYAQQNPAVIDQGVFHNDVIAVGNRTLLFCHEQAFVQQRQVLDQLQHALQGALQVVQVASAAVSVTEAVQSYLFNSQLLSVNGQTLLIVPQECQQQANVWHYLNQLVSDNNAINALHVFDLKQSMHNGGGPACLRLRVVLTPEEQAAVNPATLLNDTLYQRLTSWVNRHYRDRLTPADLADPTLLDESRQALDQLTQILQLGSIYRFQQMP